MADPMADNDVAASSGDLGIVFDGLAWRQRDLESGAHSFARAMTEAFRASVTGGKQLDDVLKALALRLSDLSVRLAFQPLMRGMAGGIENLFAGLFNADTSGGAKSGLAVAMGAIKPFASGGIIGTPSYFPLSSGGLGLAGEAGPEAIMPLARGPDGRLGVAIERGASAQVTINITTPDVESFRHSEVYLTGQIARAVLRGQRGL